MSCFYKDRISSAANVTNILLNSHFIIHISQYICYGYVHHTVDWSQCMLLQVILKVFGMDIRLKNQNPLHADHTQCKTRLSHLISWLAVISQSAVKNTPPSPKTKQCIYVKKHKCYRLSVQYHECYSRNQNYYVHFIQ